MAHANARLTVRGRLLIVERRRQGWRQARIAAAMGVSRKCVRHWLHRFATEGEAGLADRSSRPHHSPTKTPPEVEAKVVALLRPTGAGGTRSLPRPASRPEPSRVLARHAMPHLAVLNPMTGERIRCSKATAVRYKRERPGELIHVDV